MGIIKGGLMTICVVLLFVSVLAMNSFLTISWSLGYNNVESSVSQALYDNPNVTINLDVYYSELQEECLNNTEYHLIKEGIDTIIPCVVSDQGKEAVRDFVIADLVNDSYNKEYSCEMWDCLGQEDQPFFLVSNMAKDYWKGKFYFALFLVLVFSGLMFLFVGALNSAPIVIGVTFIVASLPFSKLSWFISFIKIENVMEFFPIFFSKSFSVFLIMFILGIVLIGVGVLLKVLKVGQYVAGKFEAVKNFVEKKEDKKE